jgi:hypothetical protein
MIAQETYDRELAFWPAFATLLVAGLLSSFVSVLLLAPVTATLATSHPGLVYPYEALAGAALTGIALPHALRAVTAFEITTSAALAVTFAGALASIAAVVVFEAAFVSAGAVINGGAVSLLPMLASVAVEYQLLKRFARPARVTRPPLAVEAELAYATASPSLPADVAQVAARVQGVLSSLSDAEPVEVPRRVQEALDELQESAADLESEPSLDPPRRLLVAGIRQLQGELVELAESAWRGDHRSAINRLQGVQTIENALAQLR